MNPENLKRTNTEGKYAGRNNTRRVFGKPNKQIPIPISIAKEDKDHKLKPVKQYVVLDLGT